jgi:hypothetical protein
MNLTKPTSIGLALILAAAGCEPDSSARTANDPRGPGGKSAAGVSGAASGQAVAGKKVPAGKNVWIEIQGDRRRVLIDAYVCLREGQLEHLMCRKQTKEHEAILAADVDAAQIHKALLVAKAVPGTTVRYEPTYQPATGTTIKITLQYQDKGKTVVVPAREWVMNSKTKKSLDHDWVFAGSQFLEDPEDKTKPPLYAANGGDVICVSNFEGAMLDLPINSPKDNSELSFEAYTERIPPLETKVLVILEPVVRPKK